MIAYVTFTFLLLDVVRVVTTSTPSTNDVKRLWLDPPDSQSLVFGVMACRDVQVVLTDKENQSPVPQISYGVRIGHGGNMVGVKMAANGDFWRSRVQRDLLHCNETRWFWVDWAERRVAVGRGTVVGEDELISTNPEGQLDVEVVGLRTSTEAQGRFELRSLAGKYSIPHLSVP